MKRIPLVTLLVVALAMLVAGCGLLSQKTEPTSSAPPAKEVKMVHPSGIPVLMYHKIGDDKIMMRLFERFVPRANEIPQG